ncbi:hypothetical protein BMS3Abin07_01618 [bacterium BMS3Abin07]|nr:hypothetical protein BMS3Abin07_01618 [bacterium BMS3Abin07]
MTQVRIDLKLTFHLERQRMIWTEKIFGAKNRRTYRSLMTIFMCLLQMTLSQCTQARFVPNGYVIFTARDFAIYKYTQEYPDGKMIYQLDSSGDRMITAVAYDLERKLIAIAEKNKEPHRGTAVIKIFNVETSSVVNEFVTDKDRINGMTIDREGRIAFTAGDMYLDNPGELCYLSLDDGHVHTIAKGAHFFSPAWSKDLKRVYFGFSPAYKQSPSDRIGYVELATPNTIRQIAEGRSVSISDSGKVAYLTNSGDIVLMEKIYDMSGVAKQLLRHVDPKFTNSIRFVKGTEDIMIRHWKVTGLFSDLIVLKPPYKKEKLMLPYIGMQDYDAGYVKN